MYKTFTDLTAFDNIDRVNEGSLQKNDTFQ